MLSAVCLLHALLSWSGHVVIDVNYTSPDTTIYPGTTRTFQVYVPDQYDGKTPACLYVGLDGILCRAPQVMDSLIAEGKMPITIGVFIQPGSSPYCHIRYSMLFEINIPNMAALFLSERSLLT